MRTGTYRIRNGYDSGRWSLAFYDAKKKFWGQNWDHSVPAQPLEVGERVQFYQFALVCVAGGHGWGKTGQRATWAIAGKNKKEAEEHLKQNVAGGWEYKYLKITDCGGLRHETYKAQTDAAQAAKD